MDPLQTENDFSTDTLAVAMFNNKAHYSVTPGDAVLRLEAIKYLSGSEILLLKSSSVE
jgi:hypothetical protein